MRPRPSGASTGPTEAQKGRIKMSKKEFYKERIETHKKKKFISLTDALFEVAFLMGMCGMEKNFEEADKIRVELAILAARYACAIEKDIREGKRARKKLKNLTEDQEEGLK